MRIALRLLAVLALIAALDAPASLLAQGQAPITETVQQKLDRWQAEAELIDDVLTGGPVDEAQVDTMRAALEQQRSQIRPMIEAAEAELAPLRKQLDALGEPPPEDGQEAPAVAEERAELNDAIAKVEAKLKQAGQADARASAQLAKLAEVRRQVFTRQLLTRSASVLEPGVLEQAGKSIGDLAQSLEAETAERISTSRMSAQFVARILVPIGLLVGALIMVLGLKRAALRRLMQPVPEGATRKRRVATAIAVTLVRLLIPALALGMALVAAWNSGLLGPEGDILLRGLANTLMVVIGAYALGGAFYAPHSPELRLSSLSEKDAVSAHHWLMGLAATVGLDRVLVVHGEKLGLSIEALAVLNTGLLILGSITVWGLSRHLSGGARARFGPAKGRVAGIEPDDRAERPFELARALSGAAILIARIAAVAAPGLALLGFFAASRFVFYPVVFSGAVVGSCILLFFVVQDSVDRITAHAEGGTQAAPSRIRLVPIAVAFLMFCGALPVLALIWGADSTDLAAVWRWISDGFAIGDVVISPLDFFSFLLVFAVGYVLTRVIQGVLGRSVLPVTGLDSGAKAAISAGVGYLGIILSALVAISATGLDLSNLAIVAGALSVGIGFGLQNVVNNFVSGVILLVERPIKTGDWVEINGIHGTVQKVNVRSTQIQTFDRSTMFVPNADLIANTVTNWTHGNSLGRIIVKVGVAYGSDTRQVEEILLEIAKAHPMILHQPEPFILFMGFGADSLDFEIRGVLRDVLWIYRVTSDLNHDIYRRFGEEGIEIPFAQRDLHIRNAGELGQVIGGALRGEAGNPQGAPAPPDQRGSEVRTTRGDSARDDATGD